MADAKIQGGEAPVKAPRETDLCNACLQLLRLRGIYAWRQNVSGIKRRDRAGREFWAAPGLRGVADLIGVLPGGKFLAVETKTAAGKLSPEQAAFLDNIRAAGGVAVVIRSLDELVSLLDTLQGATR